MGVRQSKVTGIENPFSSLHYLDDSRHVMMMRSMKKNQGRNAPYTPREPYPTNIVYDSIHPNNMIRAFPTAPTQVY